MEGTRVRGEGAVYAAKARRASLDGEHAVIGWQSKANQPLLRSMAPRSVDSDTDRCSPIRPISPSQRCSRRIATLGGAPDATRSQNGRSGSCDTGESAL